jgi:hypothetical protein
MLTNTHSHLQPCQQDVRVFAVASTQIDPNRAAAEQIAQHCEQKVASDWAAYCVKQQLI